MILGQSDADQRREDKGDRGEIKAKTDPYVSDEAGYPDPRVLTFLDGLPIGFAGSERWLFRMRVTECDKIEDEIDQNEYKG